MLEFKVLRRPVTALQVTRLYENIASIFFFSKHSYSILTIVFVVVMYYVFFRAAGRLDECYFRDAGNDEARGASSYALNVVLAQNNTHQCLQILHLAPTASDS